jgi:hypothetical protein
MKGGDPRREEAARSLMNFQNRLREIIASPTTSPSERAKLEIGLEDLIYAQEQLEEQRKRWNSKCPQRDVSLDMTINPLYYRSALAPPTK